MTQAEPAPAPVFDRLVIGVGSYDLARRLARIAVRIAAQDGLPVDLVSVVAPGSDDLLDRRRVALAALAEEHGIKDPRISVVSNWSVAQTLVDHVNECQPALLCVATAVRTRLDDALIGSTVGNVLHRATSPVLVVGSQGAQVGDVLDGPVVIPVDDSAESESIVPVAKAWMARTGQKAWVVTEVDPDASLDPTLEQRGVHRLASTVGEDAQWQVLRGTDPASGVVDFANEVDAGLIVMATHGRSAIGRVALGSTATRIMGSAPCPVLVRRPPTVPLAPEADRVGTEPPTTH